MAPIGLDDLEWDDDKEEANIKGHGVSFVEAPEVFNDEYALERFDDEHSELEERHVRMGRSGSAILVVVYTVRGKKHRLISARKATKRERTQYIQQRG